MLFEPVQPGSHSCEYKYELLREIFNLDKHLEFSLAKGDSLSFDYIR